MDASQLSDVQVGYYWYVLQVHSLSGGVCGVCRVLRCVDWLDAFDKLAAAGKLPGSTSGGGSPAGLMSARHVVRRST